MEKDEELFMGEPAIRIVDESEVWAGRLGTKISKLRPGLRLVYAPTKP